MYSDSEDFLILANMFGMSVKIVRDVNPPREEIVDPDPKMKHCMVTSEDRKVPDMNILFQNGNHFNLVISQDSDLAKFGNKTKHLNTNKSIEFIEHFLNLKKQTGEEVKSFLNKNKPKLIELVSTEKELEGITPDDSKNYEPSILKKIIEQLEDTNKKTTVNCEAMTQEMKGMREDLEILRIENRSLKENEQLRVQGAALIPDLAGARSVVCDR